MDEAERSLFKNDQLIIEKLPSVEELDFVGLDQNYLTVELLGLALFWLAIGAGVIVNIIFNGPNWLAWISYALGGLLLLFLVISFFLTVKGFKMKKYALRERDILYQRGLVWRKFTVLPFNRVQHAEVHQGPIERIFDLGKIKIYTAGGSSSDLSIAGLKFEQAQIIKHFILNKTAKDEEE